MFKPTLVSALLFGSALTSALNLNSTQKEYNNGLADSEYNNDLANAEYNNDLADSEYNNDLADSEYDNYLADYEYNNDMSGCEFNDMRGRVSGGRKAKRTSVRLYKTANFGQKISKRSVRRGKCYNTDEFASIKLGKKSGLTKPGKGVIVVCAAKDCTGKCQVVRRSSSKTIANVADVLGGNAVSFAWLKVKRT